MLFPAELLNFENSQLNVVVGGSDDVFDGVMQWLDANSQQTAVDPLNKRMYRAGEKRKEGGRGKIL